MENKDYTGLLRTPPSMAWLIGQRASVKGQLDRLRRQPGTPPERIRSAEAELASLDAIIPLHEVKVDPKAIRGRRANRPAATPHGAMSKCLLKQLRLAAGKPICTSTLALQFAREHAVDFSVLTQAEMMDRVSQRLQALTDQGMVRRHHDTATTDLRLWSLALDEQEPQNV